ncbi:hypothetical protein CYMTET_25053 [Cymbomonas tetramitiformis]|uniref:Uncharacterized protein n=1 Tax=Cymbomonas tetramitiformis TaxID=36881 RepID=A0AAE0KZL9_9CHLO|nr:hypothetical protein CYMTET_25053 [Cymbomonas tetramitiformis]
MEEDVREEEEVGEEEEVDAALPFHGVEGEVDPAAFFCDCAGVCGAGGYGEADDPGRSRRRVERADEGEALALMDREWEEGLWKWGGGGERSQPEQLPVRFLEGLEDIWREEEEPQSLNVEGDFLTQDREHGGGPIGSPLEGDASPARALKLAGQVVAGMARARDRVRVVKWTLKLLIPGVGNWYSPVGFLKWFGS